MKGRSFSYILSCCKPPRPEKSGTKREKIHGEEEGTLGNGENSYTVSGSLCPRNKNLEPSLFFGS